MKIVFDDGVCEEVDADPVGGRSYRLRATPIASTTGARFGDIVELSRNGAIWRFEGITHRSELVTLQYLCSVSIAESPDLIQVLESVSEAGGCWERAFGGIVFVHVPTAILHETEARIKAIGGMSDDDQRGGVADGRET